jgi:hypothetical protein
MKSFRILMVLMWALILVAGCSQEADMTAPETQVAYDKDGTETLGPPSIEIADGNCIAQGGVGMVGQDTGILTINVPDGEIKQVLLYWSGGTTTDAGDDMIKVDGNDVMGTEIGGPTPFFSAGGATYNFYAYRADITDRGWVTNGDNSFEISDFNFVFPAGNLDENHGAGMMVIYDDGSEAVLELRDGLDCAYHGFAGDLQVTVPQTFTFAASADDRYAKMVIFSGSVGSDPIRPNEIHISTEGSPRINELYSVDGDLWDTLCLEDVYIPAGATEVTVELVSPSDTDVDGASMTWIGCGFVLPEPTYCIGDYVWYDENMDGCQDPDEMPAEGVEVNLWVGCPPEEVIDTTYTTSEGYYEFCGLMPGDYTVQFVAPGEYYFCEVTGDCDTANDSNADENGLACVTVVDADDWTIDAGLCIEVEEGCTRTHGYWKNWTGLGPGNQPDMVTQYLPIWLGDDTGAKSLPVTDVYIAVDVLSRQVYGQPNNGITKLYCEMLAAKLNIAAGASDSAIADYLDDADAFLAEHDHTDWGSLTDEEADNVMMWFGAFNSYNEGDIGPGHCDDHDDDDDDDNDEDMFK